MGAMPFKMPEALESALALLQGAVEGELKANCYNTVGSFLAFYEDFKRSKASFYDFFRNYQSTVISESLSCVGLSFNLIKFLRNSKEGLPMSKFLFIASCEEMTDKSEAQFGNSPADNDLKEHVLVAMRFNLDGRFGVILLDLGYHVRFPIVVMEDECYPHTGWFQYSQNAKSRKEYNYTLAPGNHYVVWTLRETRGEVTTSHHSYIYIRQRFLSAVPVVEKKCMVYNFRTVVARDSCGPKAGFYCNFNADEKFTLFFNDNNSKRVEHKILYTYFESAVNNSVEAAIETCAVQCGFNVTCFRKMFTDVVEAFRDVSFAPFMKCVNDILEGEIDNAVRK